MEQQMNMAPDEVRRSQVEGVVTMRSHRRYHGVEIHAHVHASGPLFVPAVTLIWDNASKSKEVTLYPPCRRAFVSKEETLNVAMKYGLNSADDFLTEAVRE
jgi:hypothetical protein